MEKRLKAILIRAYCDVCWGWDNEKTPAHKSFNIKQKGTIDLCKEHLGAVDGEEIIKQEKCSTYVYKMEVKG